MDVSIWQQLISGLGFPIVMVGACGFFIYQMYQVQISDKERLYCELGKAIESNKQMANIISTHTSSLFVMQEDLKEVKVDIKDIRVDMQDIKEKVGC